jgi:hypothetical protein
MGRGKLTATENKITVKDGAGHEEKVLTPAGDEPITYDVETASGSSKVNIPADKGYYLLNLKADTLVGSLQQIGTDISSSRTITQEELKVKIDSLTRLTRGENVTAGKTFMVLPGQLLKITSNNEANVYGPYKLIPGELSKDKNGNMPEIYKFYTNTEMRQLIERFKKMTY